MARKPYSITNTNMVTERQPTISVFHHGRLAIA